jgi:DNA helicase-2/ATP-dependent DNA helicase PcrA
MRRLYLSHAWSRQLFGSTQYNPPSRFFDEIPTELIESTGNVSGRSSYGRQSYRDRRYDGSSAGEPPPYRRHRPSGRDIHADVGADQTAHRERVVDAAMRAASRPDPEPSNSQQLGLRVGDDVEHPSFGEGVVIDISGSGEKAEAVINFAGVGSKHLALAWAPLKKLTP